MEDFSPGDMAMPRLKIIHDTAVFEDSLTSETHATLEVVLLGLVKQRILWPAEMSEEKSAPLCKSYDFDYGNPNPETFPWGKAGLSRSDGEHPACADCKLKEWDSHPKNGTPWCTEQFTFPLLMANEAGMAPAVLTVQRSAIKPCKSYLSSFVRSRSPLYTCVTTITLEARKRGTVSFAIPKLVKGAATDDAMWPEFAEQYRAIREFLQTPASQPDEDPSITDTDEGEGTVGATPAPAAHGDPEADLPF
jgi:hypothetical protein